MSASEQAAVVHVVLPYHLQTLAGTGGEVTLKVSPPVTRTTVLDSLESRYPMLRGTVRDHATGERRPLIRFFACQQDISHEPPDTPLPDAVTGGREPLIILGAIAGG